MEKKNKFPKKEAYNTFDQQQYLVIQRRIFNKNLKHFLTSINLTSLYTQLNSESINMIFSFRPLPIMLHNATGTNLDPVRDSHLNSLFDLTLKEYYIPFDQKTTLSLYDILQYLQATYLFFKHKYTSNEEDINDTDIKRLFERTPIVYNTLHQYVRKICYLYSINLMESQHEYIRFNPLHIKTNNPDNTRILFHLRFRPKPTINFNIIPIPTKKITINDKARTCFRIGFPNKKFELVWASISSSTLELRGKHQYPVYCQNHVMARIKERLSPLGYYDCLSAICSSIADKHPIIRITPEKFLIPVYLDHEFKLGYLAASRFNGMIVLQTFLFITNSGTPEGIKLDQLSGLSKLDKNYLAIDKLSSCLAIKIEDDRELMELFRSANLTHLASEELRRLASSYSTKTQFNKLNLLHNYINQYKQHIQENTIWDVDLRVETDETVPEAVAILD